MKNHQWVSALLCTLAVLTAACGGSGSDESSEGDAAASTEAETEAAVGEETTTTAEPTTTTEAPTTTEASTTTTEATTTTQAIPEAPPPGTGVLTIDGVDYPFTIDVCTTEPSLVGSSTLLFEMRGTASAEGQTVEARALRIATGSNENDSFGYGYTTDRDDFEAAVSVGSEFGLGRLLRFDDVDGNMLVYSDVAQFERTEGISVVDDVDPGMGWIIATCEF